MALLATPTPDPLRALTRSEAALLFAVEVLIGGHDYGDNGNLGRRKNNQSTALILRPPQQASARKERMVGAGGA